MARQLKVMISGRAAVEWVPHLLPGQDVDVRDATPITPRRLSDRYVDGIVALDPITATEENFLTQKSLC